MILVAASASRSIEDRGPVSLVSSIEGPVVSRKASLASVQPSASSARLISSMEDLDISSSHLVDEIQRNLQNLDDEEQNLLLLRGQLSKVKRFREEQAKKDDLIATLQERINILEHDRGFSQRQSAELEEIMSERILTLERSLAENDDLERQYLQYQARFEEIEQERDALVTELEEERSSHDQTRKDCASLHQENATLQSGISQGKAAAYSTQLLLDRLKQELHRKEDELNSLGGRSTSSLQELTQELAVCRRAAEEMAEEMLIVETERRALDASLRRAVLEMETMRQESTANIAELQRWTAMYGNLEKVMGTLKMQTAASSYGVSREAERLTLELTHHKKEHERFKAELGTHNATLASIASDISAITRLEAPTSLEHVQHHRVEVIAIVRSMKRFAATLGDDNTSLMFKRVVSFIDELTQKSLSYQEGVVRRTQQGNEATQRAAQLEVVCNTLQQELDSHDALAKVLVRQLQSAGLLFTVDTLDLRAAQRERGVGQDQGGDYRTRLLGELQQGLESALKHYAEGGVAREEWVRREAGHLEASRSQRDRYAEEIELLRRMNDEALVAVKVTEYESGSELNRMREEYAKMCSSSSRDGDLQVQDLRRAAHTAQAQHQQSSLCLDHMVAYMLPLQQRLHALTHAYSLLTVINRGAQEVSGGVESLARCCRVQDMGTGMGVGAGVAGLSGTYEFEPFLDPLEELRPARRPSLRVVALYVLAAGRLQRLLVARRAKACKQSLPWSTDAGEGPGAESRSGAGLSGTGVRFLGTSLPLPSLHQLRTQSPQQTQQVALFLLQAAGGAQASGGSAEEEFDLFVRRDMNRHGYVGGYGGQGQRGAQQSPSLLEAVALPPDRADLGVGLLLSLPLQHIRLLYTTLVCMSRGLGQLRGEGPRTRSVVTQLEQRLRTAEERSAQQEAALVQARQAEAELERRVEQLEREKRSKSWHILREIQSELRKENQRQEQDWEGPAQRAQARGRGQEQWQGQWQRQEHGQEQWREQEQEPRSPRSDPDSPLDLGAVHVHVPTPGGAHSPSRHPDDSRLSASPITGGRGGGWGGDGGGDGGGEQSMDFTASSTPTGTGPISASASAYDTYTRRDGGGGEEQELSGTEGDAVRFADTSLQWGPDLSADMGKYAATGADDADISWDVPTPAFSGTDIASPSASASFPTSASASFSASDQGFRAAPTVTGPPYVPEFQGAYLSAQSSRSNQATRGSQSWQSGQSSQSLSQSQSVSMSSADWRAAPVPLYSRLPLHQPQSQPQSQPRSQSHARTGEADGAGGGAGAAEANALYSNISRLTSELEGRLSQRDLRDTGDGREDRSMYSRK